MHSASRGRIALKMSPESPLSILRRCAHGHVAVGAALGQEAESPVESLRAVVIFPHVKDDRKSTCGSFTQESADEPRSDAQPAEGAGNLHVDQPDFGWAAPNLQNTGVVARDENDRHLCAGKARSVIGASSVELLAEKYVALQRVPVRAAEFLGTRVGINSQQKVVVRRRGGTQCDGGRRFGGWSHATVVRSSVPTSQLLNAEAIA